MKNRKDEDDSASDEPAEAGNEESPEHAADDDSSEDETKPFERPDNLRRRSDWFQKRSGGR